MENEYMFDDLSLDIIRELKKNSRISYRKLASKLNTSTVTVIDRIKKLEKAKVISNYTISIDPLKLGYEFMAIVQVSVSHGHLIEVQKKISSINGVIGVYDVTGKYDAFVIVVCKNRSAFSKLVKKILSIPKVERTNTNVVLNVVKDPSNSQI